MSNAEVTNVDVTTEPTILASGNVSFSEIEAVTAKTPRAEPKEAKEPKAKAEAKPAKEAAPKEAKAKDAKASEVEGAETEDKSEALKEPSKDASKDDAAPKSRIIKARAGDKDVEISSDATFKIPVNGKKEEVPLQKLIDRYTGEVNWDRKNSEVDKERKTLSTEREAFTAERTQLTDFANQLSEKASKDPASAFDFVAELTGKDPVELKMSILRQQFDQMLPLFQMDEDERERAFKDQEREWRDQKLNRREELEKEKTTKAETAKQLAMTKEKYSISDEEFEDTTARIKEYFKSQGLKKDPTPDEVLEGHRLLMFEQVVKDQLPHLQQNPKYTEIMSDMVDWCLKNPGYSKDDMAADLVGAFGGEVTEDKERLKSLGRKVVETTQVERVQRPDPKSSRPEAIMFGDIT